MAVLPGNESRPFVALAVRKPLQIRQWCPFAPRAPGSAGDGAPVLTTQRNEARNPDPPFLLRSCSRAHRLQAVRAAAPQQKGGESRPLFSPRAAPLLERILHAAPVEPARRIGDRRIVAHLKRLALPGEWRVPVEQILDAQRQSPILEPGIRAVDSKDTVSADLACRGIPERAGPGLMTISLYPSTKVLLRFTLPRTAAPVGIGVVLPAWKRTSRTRVVHRRSASRLHTCR